MPESHLYWCHEVVTPQRGLRHGGFVGLLRFSEMSLNGIRCLEWTAGLSDTGYGTIYDGERTVLLHRWIYERWVGPIPEGLHIDHLCRNRACVNPFHLEPVTNRENGYRGQGFAAINHQRTHCVNGHEFDDRNTWLRPTPSGVPTRKCRACNNDRQQRYDAARVKGGRRARSS